MKKIINLCLFLLTFVMANGVVFANSPFPAMITYDSLHMGYFQNRPFGLILFLIINVLIGLAGLMIMFRICYKNKMLALSVKNILYVGIFVIFFSFPYIWYLIPSFFPEELCDFGSVFIGILIAYLFYKKLLSLSRKEAFMISIVQNFVLWFVFRPETINIFSSYYGGIISVLIAFFISILFEVPVLLLLFKKLWSEKMKDLGSKKIILTGILATGFSMPYFFYVFPDLMTTYTNVFILIFWELIVIIMEYGIYKLFLSISHKQALIASFVTNVLSALGGILIGWIYFTFF